MKLTREDLEGLTKKSLIRGASYFHIKVDGRWNKERIIDTIYAAYCLPVEEPSPEGIQRSVRVRRIYDSQKD